MLDDLGTLHARDRHGFLARLGALPDAYDGPDGARPGPVGFDATGPAAVLVPLVAPWTAGKALAVSTGDHAALVAAAAFEGRHALGDDLVALVVGRRDPENDLVEELLATRVAQVERLLFGDRWLPPASEDAVVDGLILWYAATWVAAYGAILVELDPADESLYGRLRAVA